jgi:hypothetical protein
MAAMDCRIATFPALYVLCALTVVLGAANAFYLMRGRGKPRGT